MLWIRICIRSTGTKSAQRCPKHTEEFCLLVIHAEPVYPPYFMFLHRYVVSSTATIHSPSHAHTNPLLLLQLAQNWPPPPPLPIPIPHLVVHKLCLMLGTRIVKRRAALYFELQAATSNVNMTNDCAGRKWEWGSEGFNESRTDSGSCGGCGRGLVWGLGQK
jgi:hypothetical protein